MYIIPYNQYLLYMKIHVPSMLAIGIETTNKQTNTIH